MCLAHTIPLSVRRSKALALECASDPSSHDCTNQEVNAPNLVITKIVLDVAMPLGVYGKCNICVCNQTTGEVPSLLRVYRRDSPIVHRRPRDV